jgi:hypothetical protein
MPSKTSARKQALKHQHQRDQSIALIVFIGIFVAVFAFLIFAPGPSNSSQAVSPSAGNLSASLDGKTLLEQRCNDCHSADYVKGLMGTADQWAGLVHAMVQNGADLTPEEEKVLAQYLADTYHQ